jgi:hypothetical protein
LGAHEVESRDEKLDEFAELLDVGFPERRLSEEIANRRFEIVRAAKNGRELRILASQDAQLSDRHPTPMARVVFGEALPDDLLQPLHPFLEIAWRHRLA